MAEYVAPPPERELREAGVIKAASPERRRRSIRISHGAESAGEFDRFHRFSGLVWTGILVVLFLAQLPVFPLSPLAAG